MYLFVFRPHSCCDWVVYTKKDLDNAYILSNGTKLKKALIDSGKSFYGGYYFTTEDLKEKFTENYYNNTEVK